MWQRASSLKRWNFRRFSTATQNRHLEDEGHWFYASEWWGTDTDGHTVLSSTSDKGNGVVSVVAYPSSKPHVAHWSAMEDWLQKRYLEIHSKSEHFKILDYQWRVLRFNGFTRQSTVKIMAAHRKSDPNSVCFMQQPHVLAVPYLKSMLSVGLSAIASSRNYDIVNGICGNKPMRILCIGHGGGSLPLFLATKLQGSIVHIVEIDPLVISASIQAMGFPAFAMMKSSGERELSHPGTINKLLWEGIHERLFLYESDAEKFILNTTNVYDLVFIDAYDGDDIFPRKLWDANSPFLQALKNRLHPEHGTVVVNLHADTDILDQDQDGPLDNYRFLPMGKYVSQVCQAYKDVLIGSGSGVGFVVSVPELCNSSLVICRGFGVDHMMVADNRVKVLHTLISNCHKIEYVLNLPFSFFPYVKNGFVLVD